MPNLADRPVQLAKAQLENAWIVPREDAHSMTVKQRKGAIMGRVTANCWRAAGRTYYQVRGPESPQVGANGGDTKKFVFCEAEYRNGRSRKLEKYSLAGATKLWNFSGQAAARSVVAAGRYRIERENGCVALTFWTPENEEAETIRFRYREDGQEGYMDLQPHRWPISQFQPAESAR